MAGFWNKGRNMELPFLLSIRVLGFLLKKEYGEPFGNGKGK